MRIKVLGFLQVEIEAMGAGCGKPVGLARLRCPGAHFGRAGEEFWLNNGNNSFIGCANR